MSSDATAVLVLENGKVFHGQHCGAQGETIAEVVFTTGLTGYEESATDPSYCGQILVFTPPHIGNTGWNRSDVENPLAKIWVSGLVMRELSRKPSNWRSQKTLEQELIDENIVAIKGIDTRTLVQTLRDNGSMRGGIFTAKEPGKPINIAECKEKVLASPRMSGASFSNIVSTKKGYIVPAQGEKKATLGILDLGIKYATPRIMSQLGVETHVLPYNSSLEEFLERKVDGVLMANGPGDPATAHGAIDLSKKILAKEIPLFGICFGNQVIGRALGRNTYKMSFGHRGTNMPVKCVSSDRVDITAQNHGFAIEGKPGEQFDTPYGKAELSHYCPNDNAIEGVRLLSGRALAVQYHPEAAAGPHDASHIFVQFLNTMLQK